jgi:hypothetical protein
VAGATRVNEGVFRTDANVISFVAEPALHRSSTLYQRSPVIAYRCDVMASCVSVVFAGVIGSAVLEFDERSRR